MLLPVERRHEILSVVQEKKGATCAELCERFGVSPGTIRNDLEALERMGAIKRTHGGAVLPDFMLMQGKAMRFKEREVINAPIKNRIGETAARLVQPGESVFIDGSTSSFFVAKHLRDLENITVVTNAERVVLELGKEDHIRIICTGGLLRKENMSYVGETAEKRIKDEFFTDKMFFSCYGISREFGIFDATESEAGVKRAMFASTKNRILLCDSTKFDKIGFPKLTEFKTVNMLVTDRAPAPQWQEFFRKNQIEVLIAE
nr:DeoR/GlpR family DNA-binding transcription regulator [uncultured Oscillibacter sp.]